MKKRIVVSLSIVITTSSLLMTACGNKNDTVSAMNNVSTETESIAESSTEIESSIEIETETQSETESTIETETQDETESNTETETSSVVGDEKETTETTEIDESGKEGAYTITDMDITMYATQQCNIRKEPSIENEVIGSLLQTQGIKVTGKVNEVSWYRVNLADGTEGYISSSLLTPTQPSVQISTPTPSTQQEAATQAEQPVTPDQMINPDTGEPYKHGDVDKNGMTHLGVTSNADGSMTFPDGTTYYPVD